MQEYTPLQNWYVMIKNIKMVQTIVFFTDRTHGKLEKMLNFLCGLGVVPIENNV